MTTHNTGNPVGPNGSADPRDLYDNAQVMDLLLNSILEKVKGRLNNDLITWAGLVKNLSPLGKAYTQEQAAAAIASGEIPEGAFFFIWSDSERTIADMFQNVGGVITKYGDKNIQNGSETDRQVSEVRDNLEALELSSKVMKEVNAAPDIIYATADSNMRYALIVRTDGSVEIQKLRINTKKTIIEDGSPLSDTIPFKLITVGTSAALVDKDYKYAWLVNEEGVFDVQKLLTDSTKFMLSDKGRSLSDVLSGLQANIPDIDFRLISGSLSIFNHNNSHITKLTGVDEASYISSGIAYKKAGLDYVYMRLENKSIPRYSNDRVVWAGDSLTEGVGGGGTTAPGVLASLSGLTVLNRGYAGRASADIALHMGVLVPLLSISGGQIPASGSVSVTEINPSNGYRLGQNNETFPGTLSGVPGNLIRASNNTWSFSRASAGSVVAVPDGTPFYCTEHAGEDDSITVTWVGRNNYATAFAEVERDTASFHEWVKPFNKQHIVIGMTTTDAEVIGSNNYIIITGINASLKETYNDCYIDMLDYLVSEGLMDAGITPTPGDITDIQNGVIPRSLRSDSTHLNAAGYTVAGKRVFQQLTELGWV